MVEFGALNGVNSAGSLGRENVAEYDYAQRHQLHQELGSPAVAGVHAARRFGFPARDREVHAAAAAGERDDGRSLARGCCAPRKGGRGAVRANATKGRSLFIR